MGRDELLPAHDGLARENGRAVVVRMGSLGDVALTTGVLEHWRLSRGVTFTFITKDRFAPLLAHHPAVEETIVVGPQAQGLAWAAWARRLARACEGVPLIDLHGSLRTLVLSSVWRGPTTRSPRYALRRRRYLRRREPAIRSTLLGADVPQRYAMALDRPPPPRAVLRPRVFLMPEEVEGARRILADRGIGAPRVVLHPYATHPLKTWGSRTWIAMARALAAAGWEWIAVGRNAERFLAAVDPRRDLTNETDLRTTCAILACSSALLTGDSGPMHLAEAVGTPVVALFGPTTEEWGFYPRGPRDQIIELPLVCRPCSLHGRTRSRCAHECLAGITPQVVMKRLEALRG